MPGDTVVDRWLGISSSETDAKDVLSISTLKLAPVTLKCLA